MASDLEDQHAFAERLRIQLQSRYRGMRVSRDPARFGLLVRGPSVEARLPLTPIQLDCLAQPARAGELIAGWVRSVEPQLTPGAPVAFALTRLLWCVRSRSYLDQLARADELLTVALGAELHAFVAESLPGVVMRGVPRQEWESDGLDDQTVRAAADHNTTARFSQLPERIRSTAHVPKDGWRLGGVRER